MKESNGRKGREANKASGEGKEKTASGTEDKKRGWGRPQTKEVEGNTAAAESKKRGRGRPRKNVETPVLTLESTKTLNKRVRRTGRFNGSPWRE